MSRKKDETNVDNDMETDNDMEIIKESTPGQINQIIHTDIHADSKEQMENSTFNLDINNQDHEQLQQSANKSSNLQNDKAEIYKYTDKGPFYVILENTDIDTIDIGIKLNKAKNIQVLSITKIGKDKARVHTKSYDSANKIMTQRAMLGLLDYKAYLPYNYVFSSGIIKNIPIKYSTFEIQQNICSNIQVETVERLTKWDTATRTANPSTTIKLVFRSPDIPEKIDLAYCPTKVELYVQRPLFCRKCLSYGHLSKRCKSKNTRCVNCADVHDKNIDCVTKCKFCTVAYPKANKHRSSSPICPTYQFQLAVKKIMTIKRLTFNEAKEELLKQNPPATKQMPQQFLFSQIVSGQNPSPSTSTIIHIPNHSTQTTSSNPLKEVAAPSVSTQTSTAQELDPKSSNLNNDTDRNLQLILKLVNILQSSSNNGSNDTVVLKVLEQTLYRFTDENKLFNAPDLPASPITRSTDNNSEL